MKLQLNPIRTKDDNEKAQNKVEISTPSSITNTTIAMRNQNITTFSEYHISWISVGITYDTRSCSKSINHVGFVVRCTEKVLLVTWEVF